MTHNKHSTLSKQEITVAHSFPQNSIVKPAKPSFHVLHCCSFTLAPRLRAKRYSFQKPIQQQVFKNNLMHFLSPCNIGNLTAGNSNITKQHFQHYLFLSYSSISFCSLCLALYLLGTITLKVATVTKKASKIKNSTKLVCINNYYTTSPMLKD